MYWNGAKGTTANAQGTMAIAVVAVVYFEVSISDVTKGAVLLLLYVYGNETKNAS